LTNSSGYVIATSSAPAIAPAVITSAAPGPGLLGGVGGADAEGGGIAAPLRPAIFLSLSLSASDALC
jgi:hypothetical protein